MELPENTESNKISGFTIINSDIDCVWNVISTPSILEKTHPYCKKNSVQSWDKVNSKDIILYYNGMRLNRIFTEWTEKKGYSLIIGNNKIATAIVEWNLEPITLIKTKLSIDIYVFPDIALQKYSLVLRTIIKNVYFLPYMRHYIRTVCTGFRYHIETGNLVKKNQFGFNPLFSTKTNK
jgi:hypothetical protein